MKIISSEPTSMPVHAPLYPKPPYHYPNAELLMVVYSVTRENIEHIIPAPLTVSRSPLVLSFVAWYPDSSVGAYHEAATFITVKLKTEDISTGGMYCNSMFVDSDRALGAGREIWGYPKKFAQMKLTQEGDTRVGILERNGITIMKIKLEAKNVMEELPVDQVNRVITLKQLMNPEGTGIELSEFVGTDMEVNPAKTMGGKASIEFNESETDPLHLLKPKSPPGGFFIVGDMVLPPGKVIHKLI